MRYLSLLISFLLVGCTGGQDTQFTLSELEDPPFQKALESRVEETTAEEKIGRKKVLSTEKGQIGQNAFKEEGNTVEETDTDEPEVITPIAETETDEMSVCECQAVAQTEVKTEEMEEGRTERRKRRRKEKVDIHFYIGFNEGIGRHILSGFNNNPCSNNKFVLNTYRKGFLSHLEDLNWQFSHSLFSAGSNIPNYLEWDGRYVKPPHQSHKRKFDAQTVLTQDFQYYEDIFSYTITPFIPGGDSFYLNHSSNGRENTISYDAPEYTASNKGGSKDPLAGLNDLLTNKYEAIRDKSRVEVFIITDTFPDYASEQVDAFLAEHEKLRVHALYNSSNSKTGSLAEIIEKTEGTTHSLCGDRNIGPKLAEIIKDKDWTRKQEEVAAVKTGCGC